MKVLDIAQPEGVDGAIDDTPRTADRVQTGRLVIATLVGFVDDGRTPLVIYEGQRGTPAVRASTTVDLHADHIGTRVAVAFANDDSALPIVLGRLRADLDSKPRRPFAHVELEADGDRVIVSAKEQLVLRCGKASLTLTSAGKVLINGTYVLSRSTGPNRIKGGSVHLN